jgi:hypothetical protein
MAHVSSSIAVAASVAIASATHTVSATSHAITSALTERALLHYLMQNLLAFLNDLLEVLQKLHYHLLVHNILL